MNDIRITGIQRDYARITESIKIWGKVATLMDPDQDSGNWERDMKKLSKINFDYLYILELHSLQTALTWASSELFNLLNPIFPDKEPRMWMIPYLEESSFRVSDPSFHLGLWRQFQQELVYGLFPRNPRLVFPIQLGDRTHLELMASAVEEYKKEKQRIENELKRLFALK